MSHPLEGLRILELGQVIAGTYGSQVLSDLGAEVIKMETPEGDLGRNPITHWLNLRRRAKGKISYRELSTKMWLHESRDTSVSYMGYAVKETATR